MRSCKDCPHEWEEGTKDRNANSTSELSHDEHGVGVKEWEVLVKNLLLSKMPLWLCGGRGRSLMKAPRDEDVRFIF